MVIEFPVAVTTPNEIVNFEYEQLSISTVDSLLNYLLWPPCYARRVYIRLLSERGRDFEG
jgi:hypothetical protein